jgi:hypothetical protein
LRRKSGDDPHPQRPNPRHLPCAVWVEVAVSEFLLFGLWVAVAMAVLDVGLYALFLLVIGPALNRWFP